MVNSIKFLMFFFLQRHSESDNISYGMFDFPSIRNYRPNNKEYINTWILQQIFMSFNKVKHAAG